MESDATNNLSERLDPARPSSTPTWVGLRLGFPQLLRRFLGEFSLWQLVVVWMEEWFGTLLRPIPSLTGCVCRYLFYKLTCKRLAGFGIIADGARLSHSYGLSIGKNFHLNCGSYVYGRGGMTIGDHVLIGQNVIVLSSQHQWTNPNVPIIFQGHKAGPVTIGDDVWIGANAVILPGVNIATGTVVGAGAVVSRDTKPYSIVAGVPAREIGSRPLPDGYVAAPS